jgi:RNA polymerase sigma factor (sigma-70 family)
VGASAIMTTGVALRLVAGGFPVLHRGMSNDHADAEPSFADLIEHVARERDRTAFGRLFDHFAPRVKSYMRRLGADDATAEDLVQEVMLTVWHRAHLFDRRQAAVSTWIFTIARNRRIDFVRRAQRTGTELDDPTLDRDPEPSALDVAEVRQIEARLRAAVDELPPEQAELLRICYFQDKSHRVIADEQGLPLGTVKSRLRLALARLRRMMTEVQ